MVPQLRLMASGQAPGRSTAPKSGSPARLSSRFSERPGSILTVSHPKTEKVPAPYWRPRTAVWAHQPPRAAPMPDGQGSRQGDRRHRRQPNQRRTLVSECLKLAAILAALAGLLGPFGWALAVEVQGKSISLIITLGPVTRISSWSRMRLSIPA